MVVFGALLLWQPCIKYKTFSTGFLRLRCLYFNWGFHAIRNVFVCCFCDAFYLFTPPCHFREFRISPNYVDRSGFGFEFDVGFGFGFRYLPSSAVAGCCSPWTKERAVARTRTKATGCRGKTAAENVSIFAGISMGILCFGVVLQSRLFLKTVYYFCVLSRVLGPDSPVIVALIFRFPTLFLAFPGSCSVVVLFISFPFGLAGISCFSRFFLQLLAFSISSF